MPLVSGKLSGPWAVVDVLLGVSGARAALLRKVNFPVPAPVRVRALLDTGASVSGFAPRAFRELDLAPVSTLSIQTTSTTPDAPHESDMFDVSLALIANATPHPFGDVRVMTADCWHADEGFEALIGMDILLRCNFQLFGPERQFICAF
jgi:Aspartyl protease